MASPLYSLKASIEVLCQIDDTMRNEEEGGLNAKEALRNRDEELHRIVTLLSSGEKIKKEQPHSMHFKFSIPN